MDGKVCTIHKRFPTGCTAVLYFDDIGKQPNDEGAFYAVLQDEQGVTHVNWWQPEKRIVIGNGCTYMARCLSHN